MQRIIVRSTLSCILVPSAINRSVGIVLIAFAGLTGCTWLKSSALDVAYRFDDWYELQPVAGLTQPLTVSQVVHSRYDDQRNTLLSQVELRENRLIIVGLGHLGSPLFSVIWDGETLEAEVSPLLPEAFHSGYLVRDLQLSFWPLESIQQGLLDADWQVDEQPGMRQYYHDGSEQIRITYFPETDKWTQRWQGKVHFQHLKYGYEIKFEGLNE